MLQLAPSPRDPTDREHTAPRMHAVARANTCTIKPLVHAVDITPYFAIVLLTQYRMFTCEMDELAGIVCKSSEERAMNMASWASVEERCVL